MSNQKLNYRKILTSERLPDNEGNYIVQRKDHLENEHTGYYLIPGNSWIEDNFKAYTEYWLEEIPNREEELADLLQESIDYLDKTKWEDHQFETLANFSMNAQNIVWEIKNNAPKLLDDE